MEDAQLFESALARTKGNKAELARQCGVSSQTIHSWKLGNLSDYARLKLEKFLAETAQAAE